MMFGLLFNRGTQQVTIVLPVKKYEVSLSVKERKTLTKIVSSGKFRIELFSEQTFFLRLIIMGKSL